MRRPAGSEPPPSPRAGGFWPLLRAQTPRSGRFVEQRGRLYMPVDVMVSGAILQQEAPKLGLAKLEAAATALSGSGPVRDPRLSRTVDDGTAALPSLLTVWERARQRQRGQGGRRRQHWRHDPLHQQPQRQDARRCWRARSHCRADRAPAVAFTSRPQRIAHVSAALARVGTLKAKVGGKELFSETAHDQPGGIDPAPPRGR